MRISRRPRVVLATVATGAAVLLGSPLLAAPADAGAAPAPRYREYVALGDSWSADVVLVDQNGTPDTTYAPIDCAQSHTNYPKLVAAELGVRRFQDATCGSAKTDHFTEPQDDLPLGGTNPAQFDRLTARTDLVTVGIGGNDAGVAGAAMDCLNILPVASPLPSETPETGVPMGGCKEKYTEGDRDLLAERIQETEPKLVRAFQQIHRISPKARILAVNYLAAVPEHACYPTLPATEEDVRYLHSVFLKLNAMVARAAALGGAELVDTFTPTLGHDVCQLPTVRYAEVYGPSVNGPAVGVPAHPNSAGAQAQARIVLGALGR